MALNRFICCSKHFSRLVLFRALLCSTFVTCVQIQAQGHFWFSNAVNVNAPVFDHNGNPLESERYRAAMYAGLTQSSLQFVADTPFLSGSNAGYFDGDTVMPPGIGLLHDAWIQIVAWDTTLGSDYETVRSLGIGGYGEANLFVARSGSLPDGILPQPWTDLQSFRLLPVVPEPNAFWFVTLGLPLLWLRRRA